MESIFEEPKKFELGINRKNSQRYYYEHLSVYKWKEIFKKSLLTRFLEKVKGERYHLHLDIIVNNANSNTGMNRSIIKVNRIV